MQTNETTGAPSKKGDIGCGFDNYETVEDGIRKWRRISLHNVNARLTLNSLVHAVGIVIVSCVDVHGRVHRRNV